MHEIGAVSIQVQIFSITPTPIIVITNRIQRQFYDSDIFCYYNHYSKLHSRTHSCVHNVTTPETPNSVNTLQQLTWLWLGFDKIKII